MDRQQFITKYMILIHPLVSEECFLSDIDAMLDTEKVAFGDKILQGGWVPSHRKDTWSRKVYVNGTTYKAYIEQVTTRSILKALK